MKKSGEQPSHVDAIFTERAPACKPTASMTSLDHFFLHPLFDINLVKEIFYFLLDPAEHLLESLEPVALHSGLRAQDTL